jgi:hypothetical protein
VDGAWISWLLAALEIILILYEQSILSCKSMKHFPVGSGIYIFKEQPKVLFGKNMTSPKVKFTYFKLSI